MSFRIARKRVLRVGAVSRALVLVACGGDALPDQAEAASTEPVAEISPDLNVATVAAELSADMPPHTTGPLLVESVCGACHSMEPPPKLAPPLSMVVGHYMQEYSDPAQAKAAIAAWLSAPDSAHSALPPHAIERFGLMPPIPLTEAQREAVAAYLVDEFGQTMMGEQGRRMRHRMGGGPPGS